MQFLINIKCSLLSLLGFSLSIIWVLILVPLLIFAAYFVLLDRKIMATSQRRMGPNVAGAFGILQGVADGVKLITKNHFLTNKKAEVIVFILAPIIALAVALSPWVFSLPLYTKVFSLDVIDSTSYVNNVFFTYVSHNFDLLIILGVLGLAVYSLLVGGWASNSIYSTLGAIRSVSQVISYEIFFILILMPFLWGSNSVSLSLAVNIQSWLGNNFIYLPLISVLLFFTMVIESNRAPADLVESEAELVAGSHVEYPAFLFALFFLSEYISMSFLATMWSSLNFISFVNNLWYLIFFTLVAVFLFVWIRATLPRFKFTTLLAFGWEYAVHISILLLVILLLHYSHYNILLNFSHLMLFELTSFSLWGFFVFIIIVSYCFYDFISRLVMFLVNTTSNIYAMFSLIILFLSLVVINTLVTGELFMTVVLLLIYIGALSIFFLVTIISINPSKSVYFINNIYEFSTTKFNTSVRFINCLLSVFTGLIFYESIFIDTSLFLSLNDMAIALLFQNGFGYFFIGLGLLTGTFIVTRFALKIITAHNRHK